MSGNHDQYFLAPEFMFWNFFLSDVIHKNHFKIIVSKDMADNLATIDTLGKYQIIFDEYLITVPLSESIELDVNKPDLPNAYLAYIIYEANKNEAIITLVRANDEYIFTFEFLIDK